MIHLSLLLWVAMCLTIEACPGTCKKEAKCWAYGGTCYKADEAPAGSTVFMKGNKPVKCGKRCYCFDAGPTAMVITGGINKSWEAIADVELYPPFCQMNSLPEVRAGHVTFSTNLRTIATCGGRHNSNFDSNGTLKSCIVFNKATKQWEEDPDKMEYLAQRRQEATAVTLNDGVYVLGGGVGLVESRESPTLYNETIHTSEFLPNGANTWQPGPNIPGFGSTGSCSVAISPFSFLIIGGGHIDSTNPNFYSNQVLEYHRPSGNWISWKPLNISRALHGCAKRGDKVIVSGGFNGENVLNSTEVINLITGTVEIGGPLPYNLAALGMNTVGAGTFERTLAFGGYTAEESVTAAMMRWDDSTWTWILMPDGLNSPIIPFGSVAVEPGMVCG